MDPSAQTWLTIITACFAGASSILSMVLAYFRNKDSLRLDFIRAQLIESTEDRARIKTNLSECEKKHYECDIRTTALEVEVGFLRQQISPRPSEGKA